MLKTPRKVEQALKLMEIIERKYKYAYAGTIYPEQFDKEKRPGMAKYLKNESVIDEIRYGNWLTDSGYSEHQIEEIKNDAKQLVEIYKKHEQLLTHKNI